MMTRSPASTPPLSRSTPANASTPRLSSAYVTLAFWPVTGESYATATTPPRPSRTCLSSSVLVMLSSPSANHRAHSSPRDVSSTRVGGLDHSTCSSAASPQNRSRVAASTLSL